MPRTLALFSALLLFLSVASAQFQFFEQMFQGGQQQQRQEPQNMPSDSSWYQQNYDNGKITSLLPFRSILSFTYANAKQHIAQITSAQIP
jgi:hypothetical protein